MLKPIFYSFFTKGSVALINFLILLISSRYLGVSSRGEISIFLLNIAVIQILNEVYTGYSLIHFLPKFSFKKILLHGVLISCCVGALGTIIFSTYQEGVPAFSWRSFNLTLLVLLNTFFCVIILGRQQIPYYNRLYFLQPALLLAGLVTCIFFLHVYTFDAYYYALLFSFGLSVLFSGSVVFSRDHLHLKTNRAYRISEILSKGLLYQGCLLLFMFMNRYNYYLLHENKSVGLYATACTLMESVLLLANAVGPVLIARTANTGSGKSAATFTLSLMKICLIFWLSVYLVLLCIPESFFVMLIGKGFAGIKTVMLWYGPATLLQSLIVVMSAYFAGRGKQSLVFRAEALAFACAVIFSVLLIKNYGIAGAAISANIAFLLAALLIFWQFQKTENFSAASLFKMKGLLSDLKQLRSE